MSMNMEWMNRRVPVTIRIAGVVVSRRRVTVRVPARATEVQVKKRALQKALEDVVVCG